MGRVVRVAVWAGCGGGRGIGVGGVDVLGGNVVLVTVGVVFVLSDSNVVFVTVDVWFMLGLVPGSWDMAGGSIVDGTAAP